MVGFPPYAARKGGQAAALSHRALAREFYAPIIPVVLELHGRGLSLAAIARELDGRGIKTRYGPRGWSKMQIARVLRYARAQTPAEATTPAAGAGERQASGNQQAPGRRPFTLLGASRGLV